MKYLKFNYIFLIILFIGFESCKDNDEEPSEMHAELNLQTLEAETAFGTLKAKRAEKSYVGLLEGDQAIGVSYTNDITSGGNNAAQVAVHLYDGDELAMLIGEVDSNGEGTFESEALSDFDASVKITIKEDAVSGKAFFPGETIPFTVQKATGNAGVYWAWGTGQEPDISGYWVVLSDKIQWGCVCHPPFTSPCCHLGQL
jgi:hypothetical protein